MAEQHIDDDDESDADGDEMVPIDPDERDADEHDNDDGDGGAGEAQQATEEDNSCQVLYDPETGDALRFVHEGHKWTRVCPSLAPPNQHGAVENETSATAIVGHDFFVGHTFMIFGMLNYGEICFGYGFFSHACIFVPGVCTCSFLLFPIFISLKFVYFVAATLFAPELYHFGRCWP